MSVDYRFTDPGYTLTIRAYQADTLNGTKALADSVSTDLLSIVDGKMQWISLLADQTKYSWLAAFNGIIEGPLSAAIVPVDSLDTVDFTDMIQTLQGDVEACPISQIKKALTNSVRDFCQRTLVWQYEPPDIDPVSGVNSYALAEPTGAEISTIVRLYQESAPQDIGPRHTVPDSGLSANLAIYYSRPGRSEIKIFPVPSDNATDPIKSIVSLQPSLTSDNIDRLVHEKWREAFLDGARFRLLTMGKKPWSDHQQGMLHKTLYDDAVINGLCWTVKGGVNEASTLEFPSFI